MRSPLRSNAVMLNVRVLPFYLQHGIPLLRILTDRGTECCGKREHHEFELYLEIEDIKDIERRTHQCRLCFGKTVMETFLGAIHLALAKILGATTTKSFQDVA